MNLFKFYDQRRKVNICINPNKISFLEEISPNATDIHIADDEGRKFCIGENWSSVAEQIEQVEKIGE